MDKKYEYLLRKCLKGTTELLEKIKSTAVVLTVLKQDGLNGCAVEIETFNGMGECLDMCVYLQVCIFPFTALFVCMKLFFLFRIYVYSHCAFLF